MIVYQTNPAGVYLGQVQADPSPLEPGVWLIPGGCVETPPPAIPEGMMAVWNSGEWVLSPLPVDEPEPVPPAPTPEEVLASIRAKATIDRGPLCKALKNMGILSGDSAVEAAKGNWPPEFAAFLAGMDANAQADAQIDWASEPVIWYTNALLQAAALNYTQGNAAQATALLDQLFGITVP